MKAIVEIFRFELKILWNLYSIASEPCDFVCYHSCFSSFPEFTYNEQLKVKEHYRDDANGVSHKLDWNEDLFERIQDMYDNEELRGPYGIAVVENIK